ncbi:ABC transporter substrate-binding protein [Agromyces mangrovi Wang et al. 2018]|uniref:ABC transporter substrate-binding protein n=1 Tax=Agromyces mangrovi TaxID=1858653 RepID=UPI002572FA43|nr:extracellular solute-binding protein [Agromyces mangrovi]BDZ64769.1 ABC transporter substrate-binding protein [Agromyces mangrovi]
MTLKNLGVGVVAASLLVGAVGCATEPTTTEIDEDAPLSGTLAIGAYATAKPALDPLIAEFEEANPGLTVTATYADNQPYQAAIRTQLSSGTAPDLFTVWPGNGNPGAMEVLAPTGYLLDLSTIDGLPALPDGLQSVTEVDGAQYVFPLTVAGIGGVYNEQAVDEAGATIPTTWEEVLEFCEAAKNDGRVAFSLGLQSLFVTQLINYSLVSTLVYAEDPDFEAQVADGETSFSDSAWSEAFEMYMEMDDAGCFTANPLGTTNDIAQGDVAIGRALATVTLTTTISQIEAQSPDGTTFGMFALPASDDPDATWMPAAAFDGFGINANAKNPAAAAAFLRFLAEPESMASYATVAGSLPSISTEAFELSPTLTSFDALWSDGRTYPFPDQLWPNPLVASAHKEGVQKVFGGQATIEDILAAMDAAYVTQ